MNLFSLQKCMSIESVVSGTFFTTYTALGTELVFEDNPSNVDLWSVPRRTEHMYTMNLGGVNIDLGSDMSKQDLKMTLGAATQKFYNDIMKLYLYDEPDQIYILKSHREETWVVKWKDISPKYLATLPPEFSGTVPIPEGMDNTTPFNKYSDIYELQVSLMVVDHNVNV